MSIQIVHGDYAQSVLLINTIASKPRWITLKYTHGACIHRVLIFVVLWYIKSMSYGSINSYASRYTLKIRLDMACTLNIHTKHTTVCFHYNISTRNVPLCAPDITEVNLHILTKYIECYDMLTSIKYFNINHTSYYTLSCCMTAK